MIKLIMKDKTTKYGVDEFKKFNNISHEICDKLTRGVLGGGGLR